MMHTNAGKGEDGGAGRSHEERTRELEIGKGAMYAVPFRGAIGAMAAVPRRDVNKRGMEKAMEQMRDEEEVKWEMSENKEIPLKRGETWCESMEGLQSAEEGRYDINTQ